MVIHQNLTIENVVTLLCVRLPFVSFSYLSSHIICKRIILCWFIFDKFRLVTPSSCISTKNSPSKIQRDHNIFYAQHDAADKNVDLSPDGKVLFFGGLFLLNWGYVRHGYVRHSSCVSKSKQFTLSIQASSLILAVSGLEPWPPVIFLGVFGCVGVG